MFFIAFRLMKISCKCLDLIMSVINEVSVSTQTCHTNMNLGFSEPDIRDDL